MELVKCVFDVLYRSCQAQNKSFAHFILGMSTRSLARKGNGSCVHQVTSTKYDIRLQIITPVLKGAFEVGTSRVDGVPPGKARLSISGSLTKEEKSSLRADWQPFIDDSNHLCPRLIHSWLASCLSKAFSQVVHGKIFLNTKEVTVLFQPGASHLHAILTSFDTETNAKATLNLWFHPVIHVSGSSSNINIPNPFPGELPYSRDGRDVIVTLKKKLDAGDMKIILICHPEVPSLVISQPVRQGGSGPAPQPTPVYYWDVDIRYLEQEICKLSLSLPSMKAAKESFVVFEALKAKYGASWDCLTPQLTTTVMLWAIKKGIKDYKNLVDWFRALLATLHDVVRSGACPAFADAKVNMLEDSDWEGDARVISDLLHILADVVRQQSRGNDRS